MIVCGVGVWIIWEEEGVELFQRDRGTTAIRTDLSFPLRPPEGEVVLPRLSWSRADFESHDFSDM